MKIGNYHFSNITPSTGCRRHWHLGQTAQSVSTETSPILFTELLLTDELSRYLVQVNQEAIEHLESFIESMKAVQGIIEELKTRDPMAWEYAMNTIRACAEGDVHAKLAYA